MSFKSFSAAHGTELKAATAQAVGSKATEAKVPVAEASAATTPAGLGGTSSS